MASLRDVIRRYVYIHFSDQYAARSTGAHEAYPSEKVRRLATMGQDDPEVKEVPENITIAGIPFTQYQQRVEGILRDGRRAIRVSFYDEGRFSKPEEMRPIRGGFPHYFVLTIDCVDRRVVHHYAHEM
jgi:hypothetical protein